MSVDPVALLRALSRQEDALLRETLMALCEDARVVAAVVEQAIRTRATAGIGMDATVPLSDVRREVQVALDHLERALSAMPPA